jgi:hypothetical protein
MVADRAAALRAVLQTEWAASRQECDDGDTCTEAPPTEGICPSEAECADGDSRTTDACVGNHCEHTVAVCPTGQTCAPETRECTGEEAATSRTGRLVGEGNVIRTGDGGFWGLRLLYIAAGV